MNDEDHTKDEGIFNRRNILKKGGIVTSAGLFTNPVAGQSESQNDDVKNEDTDNHPDIKMIDNSDSDSGVSIQIKRKDTDDSIIKTTVPSIGVHHPDSPAPRSGETPTQSIRQVENINGQFTGEVDIIVKHDKYSNSIATEIGKYGIGGEILVEINPDGDIQINLLSNCFNELQ